MDKKIKTKENKDKIKQNKKKKEKKENENALLTHPNFSEWFTTCSFPVSVKNLFSMNHLRH